MILLMLAYRFRLGSTDAHDARLAVLCFGCYDAHGPRALNP